MELINRLLLGEPETTIGMSYKVTEDGRNAASHERPAHAGSGEKRLARQATPTIEPKPAKVGDTGAGDISEDELAVGDQVGKR